LVVQEHLGQFPLLLLRQEGVTFDHFDFLQFFVFRQLLIALGQFVNPHLKSRQTEDLAHLPEVIVNEMLFEAGALSEETVALVNSIQFLVQHEVGFPATFLLKFLKCLFLRRENWSSFVSKFHVG
jgi:hypothetical protein